MPRRQGKPVTELSLLEMRALVARSERALQELRDREATLEKELASVRSRIARITEALGRGPSAPASAPAAQPAPKRRGRRGRGEGGLTVAGALVQILREHGKPMRVAELADAFRRKGHPTSTKNLPKLIAVTIKGSEQFRRVARGLYTAR